MPAIGCARGDWAEATPPFSHPFQSSNSSTPTPNRPMPPLVLSENEIQQLQSMAKSWSLRHSCRGQDRAGLGDWETNTSIAKRMGLTPCFTSTRRPRL
jgi:hypothetical protein